MWGRFGIPLKLARKFPIDERGRVFVGLALAMGLAGLLVAAVLALSLGQPSPALAVQPITVQPSNGEPGGRRLCNGRVALCHQPGRYGIERSSDNRGDVR